MNKSSAILALALLSGGSAFAQLSPLPGLSPYAGYAYNGDLTPVNGFNISSDATFANAAIATWGNAFVANSSLATLGTEGGILRFTFLGESAGWLNSIGYALSGDYTSPYSGTYSLVTNIQSVGATPNVSFGLTFDITIPALTGSGYDLWYSTGSAGDYYPGGAYTLFNQTTSMPYAAPGQARWNPNAIMINTNTDEGVVAIPSWLFSVEDIFVGYNDGDYTDFVGFVQFLKSDGTPITPVPEPATYGLIGAVALLGLVARRRFAAKKQA